MASAIATITVKVADMEIFKEMLELFREITNDGEIEASKREYYVKRLLEIGALQE